MTKTLVGLLVIGMLAAAPVASWAQAETDEAPPGLVVLMPQWYQVDEFGNQSSVREYDGREFDLVDISEFLLSGLSDDVLYQVLLSHPIAGDAEAAVLVDQSYWLSFEAIFDTLTHRFADDRNALVVNGVPTFENRVPWSPGDPLPPLGTDVLEVLSTDQHMMERQVTGLNANFTPAWMGSLRVTGSFWREDEDGNQILAFRSQVSPSSDRRKVVLTAPLDRDTREQEIGFDGGGEKLAYAYRHGRREFTSARPPDLSTDYAVSPGGMVTPNNHTDIDEIQARLKVGEGSWLTANWVDRHRRRNETNPGTYDMRTMAANFSCRPSRDLHVIARWRDSDQDLNITGPASGLTVTSREYSMTSVEARYYGMSRTVVRGSWARREIDRSGGRVTDGEVVESSTTDTLKLGLTHRPMSGMTLRLDWRNDDTDHPSIDFIDIDEQPPRPVTVPAQSLMPYGGALAKDSDLLKASLTYAPTGDYSLYADYQRLKEDRDEVDYHNEDKQWLLGGWAALSDRWSVHAEASRLEGDNGINWVGTGRTDDNGTPDDPTDDIPLDLPWPPPEHVVYDYNSRVYSAGVTYLLSSKLRLFSNLYRTTADGTLAPTGWDDATTDIINGVSPLNLTIRKYSVGFAWKLDPMTNLIAELGRERWTDQVDTVQSGSAEFVSLSLRKRM